jgi:endonuclease-3
MSKAILQKSKQLRQILVKLRRMYGRGHRWRRCGSGLDVLVEAMLAQNTSMLNAQRGYRRLHRDFGGSWTRVMLAPIGDVQRSIAICGLARMRARRLQAMLARIKAERGRLDIDHLKELPIDDAFDYLMSFHGIGPRTAAFTLLFAFDRPVLPVDNGILRVVRRLRLVRPKAREAEVRRVIEPIIPRGRQFETHILLFEHAKRRCRPKNPKCDECLLNQMCPFGRRRLRHELPQNAEPSFRRWPVILSRFASDGLKKDDGGVGVSGSKLATVL